MSEQLTLSVSLRDDARFANFYAGENQHIVYALQQQWANQGEPFIYLWGQVGSGTSHLLQACCHYAEGLGHQSIYLPLDELANYGPDVVEGIDSLPLVALDHLHAVAGKPDWEEALFHLFNRIRERQGRLLIAAQAPANQLGLNLADLVSRLSWGVTYQLQTLDDAQKIQALMLRAKQRGLNLNDDVARFILNRSPRDINAVLALLDKLDQASLVEQRKLTIPFVRTFIEH